MLYACCLLLDAAEQGESICRDALTSATRNKNLDELNLNLQKASEMGLSGPEVDQAKALQKELHHSSAALKALRCVGVVWCGER